MVSYKERPFLTVIKQEYDYSCGSAALATLLTFHYDMPITEANVFTAMFEVGDQERIRELGFSLLDMKTYLESRGIPADGFRIDLDQVEEGGLPAIALIDLDGYRHFVVIKGFDGDTVLVGDPALGIKTFTRQEFRDAQVDDIVFVLRTNYEVGQANFNRAEDWELKRAIAPIGRGIDRGGMRGEHALLRLPAQLRPVLVNP